MYLDSSSISCVNIFSFFFGWNFNAGVPGSVWLCTALGGSEYLDMGTCSVSHPVRFLLKLQPPAETGVKIWAEHPLFKENLWMVWPSGTFILFRIRGRRVLFVNPIKYGIIVIIIIIKTLLKNGMFFPDCDGVVVFNYAISIAILIIFSTNKPPLIKAKLR